MFQRYLFWIFINLTLCSLICATSSGIDNSTTTPCTCNYNSTNVTCTSDDGLSYVSNYISSYGTCTCVVGHSCVSNCTCTNGTCTCDNGNLFEENNGTWNNITTPQTYADCGHECNKEQGIIVCPIGLTCTNDTNDTLRCLCNASQFWSNGCHEYCNLNFTLQNITTIKGTNNITFNWSESTDNDTCVNYYIVNLNDHKEVKANSRGGYITGLKPGTNYSFKIVSVPPIDNYTTYNNVSVSILDLWTGAVYGQECNEHIDRNCDSGLSCRNDTNGTLRCLCNKDQFWSNGCTDNCNINFTLQNIATIKGTNNITFNWSESTDIVTDVNYYIVILNDYKEVKANSRGGYITGLKPGTNYSFQIVSVPPTDNYTTYNNVSVSILDLWTGAEYGQECNEHEDRNCDSGLSCRNDTKDTLRCLCNKDQFWSNGCTDNKNLAVTLLSNLTTKGATNITFVWYVQAQHVHVIDVEYYIVNVNTFDKVPANNTGGYISGLQPGTKYNFTIVAVPPTDNFTTYQNVSVSTGDLWTDSLYGQECNVKQDRLCDTGFMCRAGINNIFRCLCNTSQYWFKECLNNKNLGVALQNNLTIIKGTTSINFVWDVQNIVGVNYYIVNVNTSAVVTASNTGGCISGLQPGTKYNFTIVSVPPPDKFITYDNVSSVSSEELWTEAVYGQACNETEDRNCDSGLTCRNDTVNNMRCLCDADQFWSDGCVNSTNIAVILLSNSTIKGTTNITFVWYVQAQHVEGINFYIVNVNTSEVVPANNTGVYISGLQPGTKYNFTIVSVPPTDNFTTYENVSVSSGELLTDAVYGQECDETEDRSCTSGLTCRNDTINTLRCLCNESQFWSAGCMNIKNLEVNLQNKSSVRGSTNITFQWKSNAQNGVNYYIVNVNDSKEMQATHTGGSISGLQSGTKYNLAIVSVPPKDNYTTYNNVSVPTGELWTYPARPGTVVNVTQESNMDAYKIIITASVGNVSIYHITVRDTDNNKEYINNSSSTTILMKEILPGRLYTYTLHAENEIGDKSEDVHGQFNTDAKASGQVTNFTLTDLTNTSVTINWQKPTLPNGNISGYIVEVNLNSHCVYSDRILCTDCYNKSFLSKHTCQKSRESMKTSAELDNKIYVTITDLKPYKNYEVCISAVNEAGVGQNSCHEFKTKSGTPYMVKNVTPEHTSYPSIGTPIRVGLKITWTPGEYTGPTNYTICLKDKTSKNCTVSVGNSFIEFPDLLSYWDYNITIQAVTVAGVSEWTQPAQARTATNFPGMALFNVTQDKEIATKLTINIQCPDEKNRNGTITKYIINKYNIDTQTSLNQIVNENKNCVENLSVQLDNITAECTYNISVQAENQNYSGLFSPSYNIFVAAKAPIFNTLKSEILKTVVYSTTSQVEVTVCVSCISNTKQGKITESGLVVCLDVPSSSCFYQNRRRRSIGQEGLNTTWFQSKSENFVLPYRTTSKNWIQSAQNSSSINYIIGNENCINEGTFCNGPLPSGTKVRLQVIVCTGGGCSENIFIDLQTQAETDNTSAIVGGVVGGILGLAVIVAVVFLVVYFKRHPRHANPSDKVDSKGQVHSSRHIKDSRPVVMSQFKEHVRRCNKDSQLLFQSEFEDISTLSKEFPHTCNEAKKENNRVKNRYSNILPYDHSRVKLAVQPENDDSDFINANYIPGYCSVREYIATQGPIQCTIPDFWSMVWEQRSRIIVMLSDLTENDRPKVSLYWPENLCEPINYGNVIVEMSNFSTFDKYIIRNFKITQGAETRKVTHLFIVGWSDFLADLPTDVVIKFVRIFRQEANTLISGPVIVHCSAGVGRTGTFIALDYFMQYIEQHSLKDSLDVFGYVMKMRNYRPCMVQSEKQYIYIHEVLDILIDQKIKSELEEKIVYNNDGDLYANMNSNPEERIYANQSFEYDM